MGQISFTCCSTVEEKPNEEPTPTVYTYPALSQNVFPRSLSDTTVKVYPAS